MIAIPKKWFCPAFILISLFVFMMYFDNIFKKVWSVVYEKDNSQYFNRKPDQFTLEPILEALNISLKNPINLNLQMNATGSDLETLFAAVAVSIEVTCPQTKRLGNSGDGGWDICLAGGFNLKKPCLVYSFGINNDWSFDDAVVQTFGCTVRSFDPSMTLSNQKRGSNIYFYKEGLAGSNVITNDKMWRLNKFSSFLEVFNERNATIDYLKIDIEYYEWEALEAALQDSSLRNVKQLGIEIHTDELFKRTTSVENYKRFLTIFKNLRNAGFYKWYTHLNPWSIVATSKYTNKTVMCCYEFIYINTNFGEL